MAIVLNDPVIRQDIIDRFNTRVRDWVTANTNWISTTQIISDAGRNYFRNVGQITSASTSGGTNVGGTYPGTVAGGSYNRTAFSTPQPASIAQADFSAEIGANPLTVGHVVRVLREFMVLYANNHKIELMNTGNLTTSGARTSFGLITHTGTVRLDDVLPAVKTSVQNDVNAAAIARDVESGELVSAAKLLNFIEDCRGIWTTRCLNPVVEQFRYSYCHASCHGNHSSHGSRGRR